MGKLFFIFLISVISVSCVSVSTRSSLNKDYSKKRYNRIVVISTSEDSEYAENAENQVGKYFEIYDDNWVKCFNFSSDYYAGSNTDPQIFKNKLASFIRKNNADGVIFITDHGVDENGVVTGLSATSYGFSVNRATVRSIGIVMELFDTQTKASVWYSRGTSTTASILPSDEGLMSSFIRDSMSRLAKTGLLDEK